MGNKKVSGVVVQDEDERERDFWDEEADEWDEYFNNSYENLSEYDDIDELEGAEYENRRAYDKVLCDEKGVIARGKGGFSEAECECIKKFIEALKEHFKDGENFEENNFWCFTGTDEIHTNIIYCASDNHNAAGWKKGDINYRVGFSFTMNKKRKNGYASTISIAYGAYYSHVYPSGVHTINDTHIILRGTLVSVDKIHELFFEPAVKMLEERKEIFFEEAEKRDKRYGKYNANKKINEPNPFRDRR